MYMRMYTHKCICTYNITQLYLLHCNIKYRYVFMKSTLSCTGMEGKKRVRWIKNANLRAAEVLAIYLPACMVCTSILNILWGIICGNWQE